MREQLNMLVSERFPAAERRLKERSILAIIFYTLPSGASTLHRVALKDHLCAMIYDRTTSNETVLKLAKHAVSRSRAPLPLVQLKSSDAARCSVDGIQRHVVRPYNEAVPPYETGFGFRAAFRSEASFSRDYTLSSSLSTLESSSPSFGATRYPPLIAVPPPDPPVDCNDTSGDRSTPASDMQAAKNWKAEAEATRTREHEILLRLRVLLQQNDPERDIFDTVTAVEDELKALRNQVKSLSAESGNASVETERVKAYNLEWARENPTVAPSVLNALMQIADMSDSFLPG
ncbi:hypothetical protein K488DRAFT_88474 [Vararia minispora EC-137]|uniref:Uncharacterized protein n=1 Tax=Vararia minispora EC-137 TaxID=1314806 RepID=A0ACB8QEH2_9AGAM|nr:hypothetical protein K488DRAFT_88474 [Vararia minispora EC-137]